MLRKRPVRLRVFVILCFALARIALASAAESEGELKLVVILSRHGVRAPIKEQMDNDKFAAQPWPTWNLLPGDLTPHGRKQMELMGDYYRARYVQAGLLSGQSAQDASSIYFRANNYQRTIETARALGTTLLPNVKPEVHARPAGDTDPLFLPAKTLAGDADRARGVAAVLGRVGGDMSVVALAHRATFATLERVLFGDNGATPPGKTAALDLPTAVVPSTTDYTANMRGPLFSGGSMTDSFMLEYAEGMPMTDVGWGRLTPDRLTELLELHSLWLDLIHGTFFPAQVEASNLASHIGDTLEQAATAKATPGAIGTPNQKMVVIVGHDVNQVSLGGLLGLEWRLPGTQRNPVLLGGALVLELREREKKFFVRALYISPSLDQTRTLAPLTLEHPPGIAPIFIPECSDASPGFDAPLEKFTAHLRRVVDPHFVAPSAN